jgi:hypothetical protein
VEGGKQIKILRNLVDPMAVSERLHTRTYHNIPKYYSILTNVVDLIAVRESKFASSQSDRPSNMVYDMESM